MKKLIQSGVLIGCLVVSSLVSAFTYIDVAFMSTDDETIRPLTEHMIKLNIEKANEVMNNSHLDYQLRTVGITYVSPSTFNFDKSSLSKVRNNTPPYDSVNNYRSEVHADVVVFTRKYVASDTYCGFAGLDILKNFDNSPDATRNASVMIMNHSVSNCGSIVLAHELAHLGGVSHNAEENSQSRYPTAVAYYTTLNKENVATVTANKFYNVSGENYYKLLPVFSSTEFTYNGLVIGSETQNAVATLRTTLPLIASFTDSLVSSSSTTDVTPSVVEVAIATPTPTPTPAVEPTSTQSTVSGEFSYSDYKEYLKLYDNSTTSLSDAIVDYIDYCISGKDKLDSALSSYTLHKEYLDTILAFKGNIGGVPEFTLKNDAIYKSTGDTRADDFTYNSSRIYVQFYNALTHYTNYVITGDTEVLNQAISEYNQYELSINTLADQCH